MPTSHLHWVTELRRIIDEFLNVRLTAKLDKTPDDHVAKRDELRRQFDFKVWVDDAAHRAAQLQVVTHSLKPIHPDARGTNLYAPPAEIPIHRSLGSHCLGLNFERDVVGNAAALDVYKFLTLSFEGRSLLDLMLAGDTHLPVALSDNAEQATTWINQFIRVTKPRGNVCSHTLAKQLYWLTGTDPSDDNSYHLLAPLFATSLAHRVYHTVNSDRFGEARKSAHEARKKGEYTDHVLHEYQNMAVQKLGGTKPQNISQLNSERRGVNYLLASLPPRWKSVDLKPLLFTDSMFHRFGRRLEVRHLVRTLRDFLKSDPAANVATRDWRDARVTELAGELLVFGAEVRTLLPPGWSQSPDCRLSSAERQWLDPDGVAVAAEQSGEALSTSGVEQISEPFGRWLNRQLRNPLPMGDPEYQHWKALAQAELDVEDWETNHATG